MNRKLTERQADLLVSVFRRTFSRGQGFLDDTANRPSLKRLEKRGLIKSNGGVGRWQVYWLLTEAGKEAMLDIADRYYIVDDVLRALSDPDFRLDKAVS